MQGQDIWHRESVWIGKLSTRCLPAKGCLSDEYHSLLQRRRTRSPSRYLDPDWRFRFTKWHKPTEAIPAPKHEASQTNPDEDVGGTEDAGQGSKQETSTEPSKQVSLMWKTLHPFPAYLASSWSCVSSQSLRKPNSSSCSSPDLSRIQCHGQKYSAMIVNVFSKQFESVRVEQNHCQGLQVVKRSYSTRYSRVSL